MTSTSVTGSTTTKGSEVKVTVTPGHTDAPSRSNYRRTLAAAKAKRQQVALADSSSSDSDDSSSTN